MRAKTAALVQDKQHQVAHVYLDNQKQYENHVLNDNIKSDKTRQETKSIGTINHTIYTDALEHATVRMKTAAQIQNKQHQTAHIYFRNRK